MKDPNAHAPDLVESDFSAAGLQYAKNDKGRCCRCRVGRLLHPLLQQGAVPEEGVAVPKHSTRWSRPPRSSPTPRTGTFGFVGRGLRNANMTLWTNFFLNYGGEFWTPRGILTMARGDRSHKTLSDAADQGRASRLAGFQLDESMASFTQGRSAMWIDGRRLAPPLEDPGRLAHRRQGRLHRGAAGPKGQYSATYGDGLVSPRRARTRKPLICCANGRSPRRGARLLQAGGGVPFRNSILNDAEVQKAQESRVLQSVIDSAKISKLGLPVSLNPLPNPRSRRCGADVDSCQAPIRPPN